MAGFDSRKFMRELEKDIKKSVESDLRKHPEKVLNDRVGERLSAECPSCGNAEMSVIRGGKACCPKCGHTVKVNFVPSWR